MVLATMLKVGGATDEEIEEKVYQPAREKFREVPMITKTCDCGCHVDGWVKFCPACGALFKEVEEGKKLPYIGINSDTAIFKLTFAPVESKFSCMAAAQDAARNSAWNEVHEFNGCEVELVKSVVPKEEYPFICMCGDIVAERTDGICIWCEEQDWRKR